MFCTPNAEGKIRLVSKAGRTEKTVDAHRGAVIELHWSFDGAALLSGNVAFAPCTAISPGHWLHSLGFRLDIQGGRMAASRSGRAVACCGRRSCNHVRPIYAAYTGNATRCMTLAALPVYACTWNGSCDQVLYANGRHLVIKPLQPSAKVEQVVAVARGLTCVSGRPTTAWSCAWIGTQSTTALSQEVSCHTVPLSPVSSFVCHANCPARYLADFGFFVLLP